MSDLPFWELSYQNLFLTKKANCCIKYKNKLYCAESHRTEQRRKEILPENCHVSRLLCSVFMAVIFLQPTAISLHTGTFTFMKSLNVSSNVAVLEFTLPDPSTANPISTEYNQKSRNSFCNLGLASLMGGKRLVSYQRNKN